MTYTRFGTCMRYPDPRRFHLTQGRRSGIGELIGMVLLLPSLVYGSGYFLWAAPSRILYGRNLAPELPATALLEPGIYYVAVLMMSALFGAMLGPARLVESRMRWLPRALLLTIEILWWLTLVVFVSVVGYRLANGDPALAIPSSGVEVGYPIAHVVVLGLALRRFYGLLRSRFEPPNPDPRETSAPLRILQSALVVLIVYFQIPIALLYGVMGPNPAKRARPVTVFECT